MLSKRAREPDANAPPAEKRLRSNVADLFLSNTVSAARAFSLFDDAGAAGAQSVADLRRAGGGGRSLKNMARDLRRRFAKGTKWPSLYEVETRVWDRLSSVEATAWLPIALPHEIIAAFAEHGSSDALLRRDGSTTWRASTCRRVSASSTCPQAG